MRSWATWPTSRDELSALRATAASEQPDALAMLALVLDDGTTRDANGRLLVRRDRRRAKAMFERAAELGDPTALTVVADNLTRPGHSARDLARGEALYRRAFRMGYVTAADNLATTYLNLGRHHDAVRWYRRAEAAGSPTASLEIARAQLYGLGTRRNPRAAIATLERLARQRLDWNTWLRVEAMQLMADAFMNGWLARRDFRRGEAWLRRAAALESRRRDARVD